MNKRQKKAAAFAAIHYGWLPAIQYAGLRGKTRIQKFLIRTLIEDMGWVRTVNLALQLKKEGDNKTSELLFAGLREKHVAMAQVRDSIPNDPYKCPHSVDKFDVMAKRVNPLHQFVAAVSNSALV